MNNSRIRIKFKGSCLKQDKITFASNSVVNLFIVNELDRWSEDLHAEFTLKDCLFVAVSLIKNADPDKYLLILNLIVVHFLQFQILIEAKMSLFLE